MYLVLTLCLLLFLYALYSWNRRNVDGYKLPPVLPGGLPIIGHFFLTLYWANDFAGFIDKMVDFSLKSGGVARGYFLGRTYYGVVDFDDAVTVTNAFSQKHPFYRFSEPWLGKGLITASGPTFFSHRKLLNPIFSPSFICGFLDVFNDQSRRLTDMLDGFVGRGPVDPGETFRNVTLRTSCITIFGAHDEKDNDFINKYMAAINTLLELVRIRVLSPLLHSDFIFSYSKLKKKQDEYITFINDVLQKEIQSKKDEMKNMVTVDNLPESEQDTFRAFLDIVVKLAANGALSDKEIIDELNSVASASYETTAQHLAYITVLLGSYPEEEDKVYKEIIEVVGDRDVNKQDLSKLVYTEAFIKECIRIRSVFPLLARYVDKDLKLKNYTLQAGSYVISFVDGLHREPGSWGPDVNLFRPERWLEKGKQLENLMFAFGYGQRVCVGKKYAMMSMKISVAHMVRKFRFKGDFSKMKYKFDIVTRPISGQEVTIERRNTK